MQLVAEDFSTLAEGWYPASFDVRPCDILGGDTQTVFDFFPPHFKNPFDPEVPPVILSLNDPPNWEEISPGQVVYVPQKIKGNGALGYKIYGKGAKNPLSLELNN